MDKLYEADKAIVFLESRADMNTWFREILDLYIGLLDRIVMAHVCDISLFHFCPNGSQLFIQQDALNVQFCPSDWCLVLSMAERSDRQLRTYLTNIFESIEPNYNTAFWAYKHVDVFFLKAFLDSNTPSIGFTRTQCDKLGEQFALSLSFLFRLWPDSWVSSKFTKNTIYAYICESIKNYTSTYINILPVQAIRLLSQNMRMWDVYGASIFCLHWLLLKEGASRQIKYERICLRLLNIVSLHDTYKTASQVKSMIGYIFR